MRMIGAASLIAVCGILACAPARADQVPPFKGNDTGGIIKVVKFLAVDAQYGGYISFACRWVPYGANDRPLRTLY